MLQIKNFKLLILSVLVISIVACNGPAKEKMGEERMVDADTEDTFTIPEDMPQMVQDMVRSHNIQDFRKHDVISFDFNLTFNKKQRLNATVYSKTNSSKVKVVKADGTILLFDGVEVYITPDSAMYDGARFDALTWSYFALAPFKFTDDGTKWGQIEKLPLGKKEDSLQSIKLSFENGVGDAPDDWYQVYKNQETGLVEAMAYIVTYGSTSQEEAEKNPHAIVYTNYRPYEGVILSANWKFHNWNKETGLGEQIGEATLKNIQFMEETEDLFTLEEGATRLAPTR